MSKKEKLIKKLLLLNAAFTIDELDTLLNSLGYSRSNKGKTSGSRLKYVCNGRGSIVIHSPHPQNELKLYQKKQIIDILNQEELL